MLEIVTLIVSLIAIVASAVAVAATRTHTKTSTDAVLSQVRTEIANSLNAWVSNFTQNLNVAIPKFVEAEVKRHQEGALLVESATPAAAAPSPKLEVVK